jgi:hypothetical protein
MKVPINLAAADKKLRQAELLCAHLRALPGEIARDMRRAIAAMNHQLALETFFSACLSGDSPQRALLRCGALEFVGVA